MTVTTDAALLTDGFIIHGIFDKSTKLDITPIKARKIKAKIMKAILFKVDIIFIGNNKIITLRIAKQVSTMMPETMYNPNMGPYYSSYEGDRSMARGRDSFGRYTSRNNGMSRNYSRHSTASHMVEQLEDMLMNTTDERKRMVIQNCIEELESY